MADDMWMALGALLRKAQGARDADFLREGVPVVLKSVSGPTYEGVRDELEALTTEVLQKVTA